MLSQVMELCSIEYIAPKDAAGLDLPAASFDICLSHSVLEHIPPDDLRRILRRTAHLLRPGGLCAHKIDHSDHFAHDDAAISRVNFLQFDDTQWQRHADNRFAYVNRLRSSQYPPLFLSAGFDVIEIETGVDPISLGLIRDGALPLAPKFCSMTPTDLATINSLVVAAPRPA